jgi:hypothetical protein
MRQTGRSVYERYKKHLRDFKTHCSKSNFIGPLLDNHSVSIAEDMGIPYIYT